MFMIVTYPWPVSSAHVELTGRNRDPAVGDLGAEADTIDQSARHIEHMVRWTEGERLRFHWYRLRIAVRDACHRSRRTTVGK